jgi:hypothetical protein
VARNLNIARTLFVHKEERDLTFSISISKILLPLYVRFLYQKDSTMDAAIVKSALMEVLKDIQISSGYDGSGISGDVCPLNDLPGFDSMICVEAMSMLSVTLGIEIADNINIFLAEEGGKLLTIDQAADVVCSRLGGGGT